MKKNEYFCLSLIANTDDEALMNSFVCHVMKDITLFAIACIQGEWNFISTVCAVCLCIDMFIIGRKLGYADANRAARIKALKIKRL